MTFQLATMSINLRFVLLFLFLLPSTESISFNISSFDPLMSPAVSKISFQGDATVKDGVVDLIQIDHFSRTGGIMYSEPIRIWDSATQNLTNFITHFSFVIDTLSPLIPYAYSDGLVLFLAPVDFPIPMNSEGQFLGLYNTTTLYSDVPIVTVEFNTWVNEEWDPNATHMGINVHNLSSAASVSWDPSLHSGQIANVCVNYSADAKRLTVLLSYDFSNTYNVSLDIDLRKTLPEFVKIGFVATRGIYPEKHILHSWEFRSTLESIEVGPSPPPRNGTAEVGQAPSGKKIVIISVWFTALLVSACFGIAVAIGVSVLLRWNRCPHCAKKSAKTYTVSSTTRRLERAGPTRFGYAELAAATNNFAPERMVGRGGFAVVYLGFLKRFGIEVAVKRINSASKDGRKLYESEVEVISRSRHRNLVELIGWCHDQGEFLLIYEFMPNGSLDKHLFGNGGSLQWKTRFGIACGLASALVYLHEECKQCTVHRDIKSNNVLLDSSFNSKLGDFGLARFKEDDIEQVATSIAGTFGYMAPEYFISGLLNTKSDVFSFGVVALEIATGRNAVATMEGGFPRWLGNWVGDLYKCGRLLEAVDERLKMDFEADQMECLMIVGLWCVQQDPNLRPTMSRAVRVLNFEAPFPNLPKKLRLPGLSTHTIQASSSASTYSKWFLAPNM